MRIFVLAILAVSFLAAALPMDLSVQGTNYVSVVAEGVATSPDDGFDWH